MTVTSLGEAGTMVPSRFTRSWKSRLGWTGAASCVFIPVPATRSSASLGLTYSFMPASDIPAANRMKITKLKRIAMELHLDVRDLLHDEVADDLQDHRATQHDVAHVVKTEELHIVGIGVEHADRHSNWNAGQCGPSHAPVRADGPDAAAQLEALADDVSEFVQNLRQIAARALLQQYGGHEEVHVQRRNALGQLLQRDIQRQTQIVFLEGTAEFARQRLLEFAVNHLERHREGMAGAHRARHKLQAVGKKLLEPPQAGFAFSHYVQHRQRTRGERRKIGKMPELIGKQEPAQGPSGHHADKARIDQPVGAPLHSGLFDHLLQLGLKLEAAQELGGEQEVLLVGLDQRAGGGGSLGRLLLGGAHQAALEFVEIGVAECIRTDPPDDQGAGPHRDGDQ